MNSEGILRSVLGIRARSHGRTQSIDILRGIALLLMITYHLVFILHYFGNDAGSRPPSSWTPVGRTALTLFVFMAGFSLMTSYNRKRALCKHAKGSIQRGFVVLVWGLVITAITAYLIPGEHVVFGVLHLIGVSILLGFPLTRYGAWNIKFGLLVIMVWYFVRSVPGSGLTGIVIGLDLEGFSTVDWVPVLPWFGVFLIGSGMGRVIMNRTDKWRSNLMPIRFLALIGRNTLFIYLIHVPLIISFLGAMGIIGPMW